VKTGYGHLDTAKSL